MVQSLLDLNSAKTEPGTRTFEWRSTRVAYYGRFLIAVLALGISGVAISAEGYRPIRRDPFANRAEPRDTDPESDPQHNSEDPPARRYAPTRPQSAREPSEPLVGDEPFEQRPDEDTPDRPDNDNPATEDHEPRWQAVRPQQPNRRIPKPAPPREIDDSQDDSDDAISLVADDGGPIAELLLHYAANSEGELGATYHDLFQSLGPNVRLQVCCPNEASVEAFAQRWGPAASANGRQVQVINVNRPITVWARDRRICRQTNDGRAAPCFIPTAHYSYDPEKQNDLVLSSLLWQSGLVPGVTLDSFHLEGGNVVSNRRHIFIGANAYDDNLHRFRSEPAMFAELSKIFGRPAIAIQSRDGQTPWIHTDMYLTPVDSRTILVSSPTEGCRLLEGQNTITIPHRDRQVQVEFDVLAADSVRQTQFDDVARQLTDLGYQVIRVPSLINVEKDWMVTYNNVLMDYQNGQRVVYMPIYHIPELDQAAAQIYRALGFDVRPIDVSPIFQLGGAIRCLANVTRRLPFETRLQPRVAEVAGRLQVYSVDPNANRAREPRPRRERRPLPPALRENPQASLSQPVEAGQ